MRRGAEEGHAGPMRRLDSGDGRAFIQPFVEIAERRSAEAEDGHVNAGVSERAGGQHGFSSVGWSFELWKKMPGRPGLGGDVHRGEIRLLAGVHLPDLLGGKLAKAEGHGPGSN
jgi:hypothetical protein